MEKLGINLGGLIFFGLNFLILLILLRAWVYEPVLKLLAERRQQIAAGLENARRAEEVRAEAERTAQNILAEAQAQANQRLAAAAEAAERAAEEIRAAAEAESERIRQAATRAAQAERDRMLADLRGQIAALAITAAQKIIGETLDEQRQRALIDSFFSGIQAGRVTVLEDMGALQATSAAVTSAVPLTAAEQQIISQNLATHLHPQATVTFKVEPRILGGLVIRLGDRLIDNSVASQLDTLHSTLK